MKESGEQFVLTNSVMLTPVYSASNSATGKAILLLLLLLLNINDKGQNH